MRAYHGSTEDFNRFTNKLNWFTTDIEYAKEFADVYDDGILYTVEINPRNIFDCGCTDNRVYDIIPYRPFRFTDEFIDIISKLNLDENKAREIVGDKYNAKIFSFVNSDDFVNILTNLGYDSVKTIEFGHECYGVTNEVEIISKENINSVKNKEEQTEEYAMKQTEAIIAYHGSQSSDLVLEDKPMYLTDSKKMTYEFARQCDFNVDNNGKDCPTIYTMRITLLNPKIVKDEDEYEEIMIDTDLSIEDLKENGYDGMIYKDNDITYYAVISASTQCEIIDKESCKDRENALEEDTTEQENINEDVYDADGEYNPSQDSRYKKLLRVPINTLTADDIAYLFTIHTTRFANGYYNNGKQQQYWYASGGFDNLLKNNIERHGDRFEKAYQHFSHLQFPLKVYRALRRDETEPSGKNRSLSWTTDINLYKAKNSIFKNCTKIVEATITADMIQNEWTAVNYIYYSASHSGRYPENEISLKPRYKNAKLQNLHYINKDDIEESLLENDEDYHTGEAVGKDIFADRTGASYYNDLLKDKKYAEAKNLKAEVVMMSPNEYFEDCGRYAYGHYVSPSKLKEQRARDTKVLDDLKDTVEVHRHKLFMPYLNYAYGGQEGLHRMMYAGNRFGWDEKFPVLVVKYIDEERAQREQEEKRKADIENKIYKALQRTIVYQYDTFREFKGQLDYDLDREFSDTSWKIELIDDNISITVDDVTVTFPKDDVDIRSYDGQEIDWSDFDFDIEDLD